MAKHVVSYKALVFGHSHKNLNEFDGETGRAVLSNGADLEEIFSNSRRSATADMFYYQLAPQRRGRRSVGTWRIELYFNPGSNKETREALESKEQPPSNGRVATTDEPEAGVHPVSRGYA